MESESATEISLRSIGRYWDRAFSQAMAEVFGKLQNWAVGVTGGLVAGGVNLYLEYRDSGAADTWKAVVALHEASVLLGCCAFAILLWQLVRVPPVMEREMEREHVAVLGDLRRAIRDQTSELKRLRASLTNQARDNLSLVILNADDIRLVVMNQGPEATFSATARLAFASRPKEAPLGAYPLPWRLRRQASAQVSPSAQAELLVAEFASRGTQFHLLGWSETGVVEAASWYINPVLMGPSSELLEIWLEVTLVPEDSQVEPATFRYIIHVHPDSRTAEMNLVAQWENVPPPRGV